MTDLPSSPSPQVSTSPEPRRLRWSGMTDKGRYRSNNEDAFLALTVDAHEVHLLGKVGDGSLTNADYVFAVSDGMGGEKSGEFASKIATDRITRLLPRSFKQGATGLNTGFSDILGELFHAIHADIISLGRCYEECRDMGATLTLAWFTPGWLFFGHIGDSRIYYLPREGTMKQLSRDDSKVGWLHRNGDINERQARSHPQKNLLLKALGAGLPSAEPQVGAVAYEPGDRLLLCSDGVIDGLWNHTLEDMLRAGRDAPRFVLDAISEGSRDNATALVVEVL